MGGGLWKLSPRARRRILIVSLLLGLILLMVSSDWFWRMLYPIEHEPLIRAAAHEHGLDPLFVSALIRVESKFQEEDVSHVGAVGLMQLMPETAEWIAKEGRIPYNGEAELAQPPINIRLGTWYLGYLKQQFNGNLPLVAASYNAGQGRVSRWLKSGVWDGQLDTSEQIPVGETRHYVQRVFYTYDRYKELYPNF